MAARGVGFGLLGFAIGVELPRSHRANTASSISRAESLPIEHPVQTIAVLGKLDLTASPSNIISAPWNFNHSKKENETFDVATYGPSANGIEGDPARIFGGPQRSIVLSDFDGHRGMTLRLPADAQTRIFVLNETGSK